MLGFDQSTKSIQDGELELQFDAVERTLVRRLDGVFVCIFCPQKSDVHEDH